MAKYLETAAKLRKEIDDFVQAYGIPPEGLVQLGYIVNLAVRCAPRPVQGTVRKNIVAEAVRSHPLRVTMSKAVDPISCREFNKIDIALRTAP